MTPIEYILLANSAFAIVNQLLDYAQKARAAAQARGEWTPEQEAEFDARITALRGPNAPPHWVPEQPAQ